jgi:hypothetical protein
MIQLLPSVLSFSTDWLNSMLLIALEDMVKIDCGYGMEWSGSCEIVVIGESSSWLIDRAGAHNL